MISYKLGDRVIANIINGESSIVRMEDEMRVRDPRWRQLLRAHVALQVLFQGHPCARPVQKFIHVADGVDRGHYSGYNKTNHKKWEHNAFPVAAIRCPWVYEVLQIKTDD